MTLPYSTATSGEKAQSNGRTALEQVQASKMLPAPTSEGA